VSRQGQPHTPKPPPAGDEREPAGKPWLSVRPSRIERARKLIRDPGYPQRKIVDSVARLLAKHLRHGH
jgi:hypothetical protein